MSTRGVGRIIMSTADGSVVVCVAKPCPAWMRWYLDQRDLGPEEAGDEPGVAATDVLIVRLGDDPRKTIHVDVHADCSLGHLKSAFCILKDLLSAEAAFEILAPLWASVEGSDPSVSGFCGDVIEDGAGHTQDVMSFDVASKAQAYMACACRDITNVHGIMHDDDPVSAEISAVLDAIEALQGRLWGAV